MEAWKAVQLIVPISIFHHISTSESPRNDIFFTLVAPVMIPLNYCFQAQNCGITMDDGNRAGGSAPLMAAIQDPGMMMNPFLGRAFPWNATQGSQEEKGNLEPNKHVDVQLAIVCVYIYIYM